ncbi:hypothetical protein [Sediminicola sp. 1XM1-17]
MNWSMITGCPVEDDTYSTPRWSFKNPRGMLDRLLKSADVSQWQDI